jgi:hypothetical protein
MFQQAWERALATICVTVIAVAFIVMNPMMPNRIIHTGTPRPQPRVGNHFISNQGGAITGQAAAYGIGYNWQDFSSDAVMNASPAGVQGVRWVGNGYNSACSWAQSDATVTTVVTNNIGNPKHSGIYFISDEPHISLCSDAADRLTERTALIHSIDPNAKTYAVVLDGSNHPGEFEAFRNAVDYIGVDPYPCTIANEGTGCDYTAMTQRIDDALAWIPASRIVPVFQVFGQTCQTDPDPYYRMPTQVEMNTMLGIWDTKVPKNVRLFDNSYGWNNQTNSCPTMVNAIGGAYPDLQTLMRFYFAS